MARMIHGTLYVSEYIATASPGEYTFNGAVYENQADATGNGSYDIEPGFIMFIPATDEVSATPVPGVAHRYKITSISSSDGIHLSATVSWDEDGSEVDLPTNDSYAIIGENTSSLNFGLIPSTEVYSNLSSGVAESAYSNDLRRITDKLVYGYTGPQGFTGIQGETGIIGLSELVLPTRRVSSGPDTVLDSDVVVIATDGTFTINLPAATGSGRVLYIKSASTGVITVDGDSFDTMDGSTDLTLAQYDSLNIIDYYLNQWAIL
jgi:hypothetical protein